MARSRGRRGRGKGQGAEAPKNSNNTVLYVCGAIGTLILLGGSFVAYVAYQERRKKQVEAEAKGKEAASLNAEDLEKMIEDEGTKIMQKGLKKDTPGTLKLRKMVDTVDIESESNECRLILAQFMRWRLDTLEVPDKSIELRKLHHLLNFDLKDESDALIGSWIKIKFDVAFGNKSMSELAKLRKQLETFEPPTDIKEISHTQYWQALFKLACIFGDWEAVDKYGEKVQEFNSVVPDPQTRKPITIPLFQTYQQLSRKEPSKYPNYYVYYLKSRMFQSRFDSLYQSHLQFLKWNILSARTQFREGSAADQKWQEALNEKKEQGWKDLTVKEQDIWIFGSLCQLRLNAIEETSCVLTGPWNDTEMMLVGTMVFSVKPQPQAMGFLMRIDVSVKLERQEWQPKIKGNKGGWLWSGKLVYDRLRSYNESWRMQMQELYDIEMVLEEIS